jgi:hypothetical protein
MLEALRARHLLQRARQRLEVLEAVQQDWGEAGAARVQRAHGLLRARIAGERDGPL